jgi:hypothetical protein
MSSPHVYRTEAVPRSHNGGDHQQILHEIRIKSDHPAGSGTVHLTPEQALYAHSRLSNIVMAFLHGHPEQVHGLGVAELPSDHEYRLGRNGTRVWPISHEAYGQIMILDEVVIENEHFGGHGVVHLSPEQAQYLHRRLTQLTLQYLHENRWGGEDARSQ